jgi:Group II intron, maturase-specific domain
MSGRRQNNQPEQLGLALVPGSRSEAPDDRRTRARTARGEARVRIAPKALQRFKLRVRELTRRTGGISLKQMVTELALYLRGWHGHFGFCQTPSVLQYLDKWLRRRVRAPPSGFPR